MILTKRTGTFISAVAPVTGCMVDYASNYNPLAQQDDGSCTFPDNSALTLIVESAPNNAITHGVYVQNEFEIGYPAGTSVIRGRGLTDGFQYANNTQLGALVYSYGGLSFHITQAMSIYPATQMFMPLGSNESILLPNPSTIPVIITCGAGTTFNETGYGPGLEFFDSEDQGQSINHSSFSNGKIAGKIMNIRNTLSCSFWEARFRARITADRTLITHPEGEYWNSQNGFGKINVQAAIDFVGSIPADPYINGGNTMYPYIP